MKGKPPRQRRPTSSDGILVVDKPQGITSHDVVARLRRLGGTRAVGHAGTLDPMATGVLVCGIGKGTKLLTYISGASKTYDATIRLGVSTDSDDADGLVVSALGAVVGVIEPQLGAAVAALTGDILQVPATVSAIKVAGERAYALARRGADVQLKARPVTVTAFKVHDVRQLNNHSRHYGLYPHLSAGNSRNSHPINPLCESPGTPSCGHNPLSTADHSCHCGLDPQSPTCELPVVDIDVTVTVSSGTYVRALARDLGAALGVGGHLTRLRRTWIGGANGLPGVSLADAVPLAGLESLGDAAYVRGLALPTMPLADAAARFLPTRQLTTAEAVDVGFGRFITASECAGSNVAALSPDGRLAAILTDVEHRGQLRAKPAVVLTSATKSPAGSVVTFGSFDGVQRGHQALLAQVKSIADEKGLKSVALTFDPHPGIFHGSRPGLQLIQGITDRVAALKAHGLNAVEVIPYNQQFAAQTAEDFVQEYLVNRLGAKVIVLGSDARFGAGRTGDLALLRRLGEQHGFEVVEFSGIGPGDGELRWSSTLARHAIAAGNMPLAHQILGRDHTISGVVVHGDHRGRTLGFPTANLADITGAIPADGVYAGWLTVLVDTAPHLNSPPNLCMTSNLSASNQTPGSTAHSQPSRWPAAISIGTNPTFTEAPERRVEAYVLDQTDLNLYVQQVQLAFVQQIRPTLKFDSVDALVAQMHQDVTKIRTVLF